MPVHQPSRLSRGRLSRRHFLGLGAGVLLAGCGDSDDTATAPVTVRTCFYAKNHDRHLVASGQAVTVSQVELTRAT